MERILLSPQEIFNNKKHFYDNPIVLLKGRIFHGSYNAVISKINDETIEFTPRILDSSNNFHTSDTKIIFPNNEGFKLEIYGTPYPDLEMRPGKRVCNRQSHNSS